MKKTYTKPEAIKTGNLATIAAINNSKPSYKPTFPQVGLQSGVKMA